MKTLAVTMFRRIRRRKKTKRGGALIISLVAVTVMAGMSAAILGVTASSNRAQRTSNEESRALYTAEAGVSDAVAQIEAGIVADIGSAAAPITFGGGAYWVDVDDNGDDTFDLTAHAVHTGGLKSLEVIARNQSGGIFANAIFAGNEDGDPNYVMGFGGVGAQGDEIGGDIYSGGDINVTDDASVHGALRAAGTIGGSGGEEGVAQPIPNIAGMNYAANNDVDVAAEFGGGSATRLSDGFGGHAWQLPENNPAHIFRLNPSDRGSDTSSTNKDDYFLEDPYESVRSDSSQDGSNPSLVTLSGGDDPGPDGNDLVYYIDGNLWVHNKKIYSFVMLTTGRFDRRTCKRDLRREAATSTSRTTSCTRTTSSGTASPSFAIEGRERARQRQHLLRRPGVRNA